MNKNDKPYLILKEQSEIVRILVFFLFILNLKIYLITMFKKN